MNCSSILGYARLIEDCGTLRRFESPPEQILRFLGSNVQVIVKACKFTVTIESHIKNDIRLLKF